MSPEDSIPYEVRMRNYIYRLQQEPKTPPTEDELDELDEILHGTEYTVNRLYGETVRPVMELIQMGRIEDAVKQYESIAEQTEDNPIKSLVKIK